MKSFAVFLFVANFLWWAWLFASEKHEVVPQQQKKNEIPFAQAEKKLQLIAEITSAKSVGVPESDLGGSSNTVDVANGQISAADVVVAQPWCGETGNITNRIDAQKRLDKWLALNADGEILGVEEAVSSTWWVHLSPFADEGLAKKKLAELQEKKIDSYYMRSGDLAGGISLGVFSRKQSATTVQAELLKKGYKAEIKEIPRTEERFRLMLRLGDRVRIQEQPVRELLAGFQQLALQEIPCK